MIHYQSLTFNPFQENTFILWNSKKECIILDPGCSNHAEEKMLADFISTRELSPAAVWLTHCHIDHVLGLNFCLKKWSIPYFLHDLETEVLKSVEVYAPAYGFVHYSPPSDSGINIREGEIRLGEEIFEVLFVPGHSEGHLAFHHAGSSQIWSGDVLFRESIGRTDLPGGNFSLLEKSIREKLYQLPDETRVHPGHGPDTSIGHEKIFNPFVSAG